MIVAASSMSCKNFNVVNCLNISKVIKLKLRILAYRDKLQLLDKGDDSESNIFGVMPLFNLKFLTDKHYQSIRFFCVFIIIEVGFREIFVHVYIFKDCYHPSSMLH
jgi:hypothetical protein